MADKHFKLGERQTVNIPRHQTGIDTHERRQVLKELPPYASGAAFSSISVVTVSSASNDSAPFTASNVNCGSP
jgi:hypothetical protein